MQYDTIKDAVNEARRFIKAAEPVVQAGPRFDPIGELFVPAAGPRETAALRRASMDLTRKLADLRQGRR
jgi:hypothetical protein